MLYEQWYENFLTVGETLVSCKTGFQDTGISARAIG